MSAEVELPTCASALIIAHPGHELRLHGWLERARPLVFVLTDGSGSTRESRLAGTERVLAATDARPAPIFGRFTDRQWYEAILRRDSRVFMALADEVSAVLVRERIEVVVSDAEEGYNSGHDLCHAIARAAVWLTRARSGSSIAEFDFLLVGDPGSTEGRPAACLRLDDDALRRKLSAARDYPEMASEVDSALRRFGLDAFRVECLRRTVSRHGRPEGAVPFYERFGEQQVAAGLYSEVIRAREHVLPLINALRQYACTATACAPSSSC